MNMLFVDVIAWIFGVSSTILIVLRIIGWLTYTDIDKIHDAAKGIITTFPVFWPSVISVLCWAWLITN